MKVIFLAGGKGTRLGLTDRPKPMVDIAGRPLLAHLVDVAKASGYEDLVFLTGHMGDVIERHFGDGSAFGVNITYLREQTPLGTAGAIREARQSLGETFIVVYGDILLDVDLRHLADYHRQKGGIATLFAHPNDHPHDSDLIMARRDGRIDTFLPKPHVPGAYLPNLVSAAIYVMDQAAIDFVPADEMADWGRDIFPAIVNSGAPVYAYRSVEYAKDMGTPERLAKGERHLATGLPQRLSRRNRKPAIFLDRDGVLNQEVNGVHRPEDLRLLDGTGEALKAINQAGVPAICVTNQPDIAKGFMTEADLARVHCALDTHLAEQGSYLDDLDFCPHHPQKGFSGEVDALKIDCTCRKPKPGMLLAAAERHNLDLSRSWLVGDRYTDVAAAKAAGAKAALVMTGHAGSDRAGFDCKPDFSANTLSEAVAHILGDLQ
jgi:histidinol-phosphate phosphatase family protein